MPTTEHHAMNSAAILSTVLAFAFDMPWPVIVAGTAGSLLGVVMAGSMSYKRGLVYVLFGAIIGYYCDLVLVHGRIESELFTYRGITEQAAKGVTFFVMAILITYENSVREVIKSHIESWRVRP